MNEDQGKRFADKSTRAVRETFHRGSAAAEESARGAERSYFAAAEGIRDFNLRLMEMAQTNTMAALDFARELSTAKNPPEAASLWSSHVRKQFEILTEQSKELAALSQNIVASSTGPITRGFGKPLQGS